MEMRFKIGPEGKPVFIGSAPDGSPDPTPDPKLPRYAVSYADLLEAAKTGRPVTLTRVDDDQS